MIYNIHQILKKHSLLITIMQEHQPMAELLSQYYDSILKELTDSAATVFDDFPSFFYNDLSAKIIPKMKIQCDKILNILKLDQNHQHLEKRKQFADLMKLLKHDGALRELITERESLMVRIRQGNGPYDRKALFHIPYNKRQYVSSQRFNISGDPCLYLSVYPGSKLLANKMLELSWMESGMPKVFHFCLYELQEKLVFLHFAKKGSEYLQEYDDSKTDEQKADRLLAIEQYLLTLPLRIACFVGIDHKYLKSNTYYYEEYVIPQLLMEWIQQSSYFDGLAYQSASGFREARSLDSYNVVIPTKNIDLMDGYDKRLKKCFKLSAPEKISILEDIRKAENEMMEVFKYSKKLEEVLLINPASGRHPYRRLLAICYSLYSIYSSLKNENDLNAAFPMQQLDALYHSLLLISKSIDNAETAEEWVASFKYYKNDGILTSNDYNDVLKDFHVVIEAVMKLKTVLRPEMRCMIAIGNIDFEFIK